jgi:hypothetical protein
MKIDAAVAKIAQMEKARDPRACAQPATLTDPLKHGVDLDGGLVAERRSVAAEAEPRAWFDASYQVNPSFLSCF